MTPTCNAWSQNKPATNQLSLSSEQARTSVQWLAELALRNAPRTIDGDKDWGETKKVWAGVKIRRDGFQIKTHRRWEYLNHGRWLRFSATLPDSNASNAAKVSVQEVESYLDPETMRQRWRITSTLDAPIDFVARIQRWNIGVRLFSMTVSGRMRIALESTLTVGIDPDYGEVPPAIVVDPIIEDAQIALREFEVERISNFGGDFAEEWGELLESTITDRIVDKQNEKLTSRLNRAIDKQRDDLRISLAEWLRRW